MASLSPTFHARSFGTVQKNSKRSPISSGTGSGGITFTNVIETLAQSSGKRRILQSFRNPLSGEAKC